MFASGGLLVNLLLSSPNGGMKQLKPADMLQAARLLGWRIVAAAVAFTAALFAFGWFAGFVLEKLLSSVVEGFLWLGLWWFGALVLAAFSFRRLGLWYHYAAPAVPAPMATMRDSKQRGSQIALARAPV